MGFELGNLGTWTEDFEFHVDAVRTKAYAEATNDPTPSHRDGTVAPPMFAVVPIIETGAMDRATDLVVDLHPEEMSRRVHGEHHLVVHQPIRPGMDLTVRAATTGVFAKSTGTLVVTRFETVEPTGEPLNTQWLTTFLRGVATDESRGDAAPAQPSRSDVLAARPTATSTQRFDADQTYRYTEASGDHTPIHVDDAAAKSAGLPGIIIHGLCSMAVTGHGVASAVAADRPTALRRLAVRFAAPAFPNEAITTTIWAVGRRDGLSSLVFETIDDAGNKVLTNGLAEFVDLSARSAD